MVAVLETILIQGFFSQVRRDQEEMEGCSWPNFQQALSSNDLRYPRPI
jgi:hypothetical protein